jgi:phosphoribosyl 1,2-cyclic phosphodiesterase
MTAPHAAPDPARAPAIRATCWGTRGSIPSPGPDTIRYGGNTSCVEVRAAGRTFIFDAGTGIRALSEHLAAQAGPVVADLFVSHFHWDHIQGFPFFTPLYRPGSRLRIHGPRQGEMEIARAFSGQMAPMYFPIPMEALAAELEFVHVNGVPWTDRGVEVASIPVRHGQHTCGYRITVDGAALAYVPDNELGGDGGPGSAWYDGLVAFLRGVDVLFHDAMYTDAEYDRFRGWGHSSVQQAVRLAEDAGVRRLHLFHHAPARTDGELDAILADARADLARRGSALVVEVAAEGREVAVLPAAAAAGHAG